MPIRLNDLKNNTRTITAVYFGEECQLTYKPSELTPEIESEIREATDNEALVKTLCGLIVKWDVEGEPGVSLPIEPEVLKHLPSAFLSALLQACREDMIPKARSGRK